MPTSLIPGFISKKEATELYERSHRQLTRDVCDALLAQDAKVVPHLRLRTDDGQVREGREVTIELVKRLRLDGANPVWYLRSVWLDKTFGRRSEQRQQTQAADEPPPPEKRIPAGDFGDKDKLIAVYEATVAVLQDELKIKNQQIHDASERQRETNKLTQELHLLLHAMLEPGGQRIANELSAIGVPAHQRTDAKPDSADRTTADAVEEGTRPQRKAATRTTPSPSRKKTKPAKSKTPHQVPITSRFGQVFPTFAALLRRK